jgi:hypothetical protein
MLISLVLILWTVFAILLLIGAISETDGPMAIGAVLMSIVGMIALYDHWEIQKEKPDIIEMRQQYEALREVFEHKHDDDPSPRSRSRRE